MIDGSSLLTLPHHHPSSHETCSLRHATLRRKSAHLWDSVQGAIAGYPSPPMSSPPSPTRRPSDLTLPSTARGEHSLTSSTNPPLTSATPAQIPQPTTLATTTFGYERSSGPSYPHASFATGPGLTPIGPAAYPATSYAPPPVPHRRTDSQEARKAKTHVASACVNCKRAHLSCDVQRPCARCVASGKQVSIFIHALLARFTYSTQDTCYDVAHKKRGRPRLRDESQFGSERSMPATNASSTATAPMTTPTRPIAATRQRRAESFRSIQSMTSEESSSYGPPTPSFLPRPPVPFQTPLTYQAPGHPVVSPPSEPEIPTALLDLDFVIIRANTSFQQIMANDQDLRRSRLHEIAAPADAESFMAIRSRLRGEREAREPSYLPPIVSSGEDPLGGVSDSDVENLTRGFSDHTYTWIQLRPGPRGAQTFPARIRLAKAATYFAVVSLPSFRPMDPAPPPIPTTQAASPYTFGPPLQPAEEAMRDPHRHTYTHSAPPSSFYSTTEIAQPQPRYMHRRAPSFSRSYPPPQPQYSHTYPQPQAQHFLPSQPLPGPATEPRPSATHPPAMPSQYPPTTAMPAPPSARDVQLPPITASPVLASTPGGPLGMPPVHESLPAGKMGMQQRNSESDEDSESRRLRSPRKRRRMGIDEVLQK